MTISTNGVAPKREAVADPPAVRGVGISCSTDPVAGGSDRVTPIQIRLQGVDCEGQAKDLAALIKALDK